ncbi:MAG TPA: VOC family protein [Candidatus Binatia bacterium]|jgi:catechol 2,3-dioxygenase-like lactoylglutathione lyase family enzyme|nr:VOC family protein [Candidatus Binatia bacterium]
MIRVASMVLVVRSLERALVIWETGLGLAPTGPPRNVSSIGAWQIFLRADNLSLELLEPHDHAKPAGRFLAARGEGLFALALAVEDADAARARLAAHGVSALAVAEGPEGERWYLRPADAHGILVELTRAPAE